MLSSIEEMKNLLLSGLRRKNSTLSLRSVASFAPSIKTKEAMKQFCRDLYRAGVRADKIQGRKDQAVAIFQDPDPSPVVNQDVPQTVGPVIIVQDKDLLESGNQTVEAKSMVGVRCGS